MTVPDPMLTAAKRDFRLVYSDVDYEQYYGRYSAGKYQQAKLEYLNWIKRATPMVASSNSSSPSTSSSSLTIQSNENSRCSSTSVQSEVGMTKKNDETAETVTNQIVFGVVAFMCIALIPSMIALICMNMRLMQR